jgi:hypothetical protein
MVPLFGWMTPEIVFMSVLFSAPLSPSRARTGPHIEIDVPESAQAAEVLAPLQAQEGWFR